MQYAVDCGINWTWYLAFEINADGSVTIFHHDRGHSYKRQGWYPPDGATIVGDFRILESGSGRIATAVILNGVQRPVANPRYVFRYLDLA